MDEGFIEWAWDQRLGGDVSKRLIVLAIAHHANEIRVTEVTHEQVMRWASLDADEYQNAIADLQNSGLLTVLPAERGNYQFVLNGYKDVCHEH